MGPRFHTFCLCLCWSTGRLAWAFLGACMPFTGAALLGRHARHFQQAVPRGLYDRHASVLLLLLGKQRRLEAT